MALRTAAFAKDEHSGGSHLFAHSAAPAATAQPLAPRCSRRGGECELSSPAAPLAWLGGQARSRTGMLAADGLPAACGRSCGISDGAASGGCAAGRAGRVALPLVAIARVDLVVIFRPGQRAGPNGAAGEAAISGPCIFIGHRILYDEAVFKKKRASLAGNEETSCERISKPWTKIRPQWVGTPGNIPLGPLVPLAPLRRQPWCQGQLLWFCHRFRSADVTLMSLSVDRHF